MPLMAYKTTYDTSDWREKMMEAAGNGLPVTRLLKEVLDVPRTTFYHIVKNDDEMREVFDDYKSALEAWYVELGMSRFINIDTKGNESLNTPLYKLFMSNLFGWSDRQEVDQKVDQKTTVEVIIGGGDRPALDQGSNGQLKS